MTRATEYACWFLIIWPVNLFSLLAFWGFESSEETPWTFSMQAEEVDCLSTSVSTGRIQQKSFLTSEFSPCVWSKCHYIWLFYSRLSVCASAAVEHDTDCRYSVCQNCCWTVVKGFRISCHTPEQEPMSLCVCVRKGVEMCLCEGITYNYQVWYSMKRHSGL